jgi:hypothetical protein
MIGALRLYAVLSKKLLLKISKDLSMPRILLCYLSQLHLLILF